jgi:hypothetical protein
MIRFAGTLIDYALGRGYLVGLALAYSDRVAVHRPAPGRGQLCVLLDALADADGNPSRRIDETLGHVEPASVRSAIVVAVSLDSAWRPGGPGQPVPFGCRRLLVVNPRNVGEVFEDDPLSVAEGSPCP